MSFWQTLRHTLSGMVRERPVFGALVLAVVLYGFFYPAAYYGQVASGIPVVVVDLDNSSLSRSILRNAAAVRAVHIVQESSTFSEAEALLRARRADAILFIPDGLEASALRGKSAGVALYLSGAYLVRTKALGVGLGGAIAAAAKERLEPLLKALGPVPAVPLLQRPLYNPQAGYGSYIVPAVAGLIVQQTLLLGVSTWVCLQRQRGRQRLGMAEFFGEVAAFVLVGCLSCLYFFGFVFWLQDYPRAGNLAGLLVVVPVFTLATVMLAMLLGSFFDQAERPAQILVSTSVPAFFLTGASWPLSAMPVLLAQLAWLIPSTAGVRSFVQLNQMGASLAEVGAEVGVLALLTLLFGGAAFYRLVWRGRWG